MDPGQLAAYLLALTQVEEMMIARSHVLKIVYRYYTGITTPDTV